MTVLERRPRRCLLFVPGSRPDRYGKALATGADQVCIDLEDAVAVTDKERARAAAYEYLDRHRAGPAELGVRINSVSTALGEADLAGLARSGAVPDFVMVPKVETAAELQQVEAALHDLPSTLIAQIESPRGVLGAREVAHATPRLQALMFGGFDYVVALRGRPCWESFLHPRAEIATVAADAGVGCLDVPYLDIRDPVGLAAETDRVVALGFTGKAAIHPSQVAPIQRCYLPTAAELAHARRVLDALNDSRGDAIQLDGKLVDRPIETAARRTVALGAYGVRDG